MSAVIPAPEDGSNPAIVSTTGGRKAMPPTLNPNAHAGNSTSDPMPDLELSHCSVGRERGLYDYSKCMITLPLFNYSRKVNIRKQLIRFLPQVTQAENSRVYYYINYSLLVVSTT